MKAASASIFFDGRNMPENRFMVKVSVYFNDKQRQFASGLVLDIKDVEFLKSNKHGLTGRVRDAEKRELWHKVYGEGYFDTAKNEHIPSLIEKARQVIFDLGSAFDFDEFSKRFKQKVQPGSQSFPNDVILALRNRSKRMYDENRMSNAANAASAANSLSRFIKSKKKNPNKDYALPFEQLTPQLLKEYEEWMLREGKSIRWKNHSPRPASLTTVGIYCRNIKTVFNDAIRARIVSREAYPFGKSSGYVTPTGRGKKKAMSSDLISDIYHLDLHAHPFVRQCRDMWVFSYLCNGMNFSDIFRLKWHDVNLAERKIRFIRNKTKTTKRDADMIIEITLLPRAVEIIEEYGTSDRAAGNYVFHYLVGAKTEAEIIRRIRVGILENNRQMIKVLKMVGFEPTDKIRGRTYEARHSFATTLVRANVPVPFISKGLGHGSLETTETYIGSFEDEQIQTYLGALIPEPKNQ